MSFGILSTLLISLVLQFIWRILYSELDPHFMQTTYLYCIAAIFQSAAEPFLVKATLNFDYTVIAKAESVCIFTKTLLLYYLNQNNYFYALNNFGICQLYYGVSLMLTCYYFSRKTNNSFANSSSTVAQKPRGFFGVLIP